MKKLFSFLAIIGIILVSNCSRIPENNDPVIGIWSSVDLAASSQKQDQDSHQEWIFNDAYLGRYQTYLNGKLDVVSDFKWSEDDGEYKIQYPGIANKLDDVVTMAEANNKSVLKDITGNILAIRD